MEINEVVEGPRGCGFRKPGGYYLRTDDLGMTCGRLPIELSVCPCCSQGIKQTRGFNWITAQLLLSSTCKTDATKCEQCPFNTIDPDEKLMLIWIGARFYSTVESFLEEARFMGISRRLKAIPRGFELGVTRVALAHPHAITRQEADGGFTGHPGIFHIFTPKRIEYVVGDASGDIDKTPEQLLAIQEQGVDLVRVFRPGSIQNITL